MQNQQSPSFTVECAIILGHQHKNAALSLHDNYLEIHYHKEELFCTQSQTFFYEQIKGAQFTRKLKIQKSQSFQSLFLQIGKRELEIMIGLEDSKRVRQYMGSRVPQTNFSKNYKVIETIRRTQNGEVYKCQCFDDNQIYAAKFLKNTEFVDTREIRIHKLLAKNPHENVQAMKEYYLQDNDVIIILPFSQGGTLHQFMTKLKEKKQKFNARKILKQILKGLSFLHSLGIIHRDIKLDNIMVEEYECSKLNIQIIDFGLAVFKDSSDYMNERCGTVGYLAPEIANEEDYDELCDIFSLSQVFHVLLTGNLMYDKGLERPRIILMSKLNKFEIAHHLIHNNEAIDLLQHLMLNKSKRYSADQCLKHKYFQKLKVNQRIKSLNNLQFQSPFHNDE